MGEKDKNVIGEETTGSGSGKHSIWLPEELVSALRLNAIKTRMRQKEFLNEIVITWLLHRKAVEEEGAINLKYSYPYPYMQMPTKNEDTNISNYTLYLERNISSWVLRYAYDDKVKVTTVLYTAIYLGLVKADWFKSIGHYYSLKKNEAPDWPIK